MAAKKSNARKSFYEVIFVGKPKVVRAFLKGFIMGVHDDAEIYYSFNSGIQHEGKAEKIAEMVGLRGIDCHVVVDATTSALLKKNAKRITNDTGLEISSHRHIRSASLSFQYHAYARRYDKEIVDLVKNLPAGLRVDGFEHNVKVDPKAKGVEAYSVAHEYEAHAHATITGRIDLLVALKVRFADLPLVQVDDIELKLA